MFVCARLLFASSHRLLAVAVLLCAAGGSAEAAERVDYNRDVRPILSQHCFKCHGVDDKARKGKLRLDEREPALLAGKSGEVAIVPGKPGDSEVIRRVLTDDEDEVMPPTSTKTALTPAQKQTLRAWVEQGAEYQPHWAFVAPKQAPPPAVKQKEWVRNPIDAFVLARLEKEGLKPSAEADKYTLARRLYLDLIGLPPTPREADDFAKDNAPDAYDRLVDRLLASPAYGERWARRWLDLARYADTNGYEKDRPRSIWPYRDWVIKAINADKPFDQFTVEQLAGDMLPGATLEQKVATGFHRNTMRNEEGGIDPLEFRYHAMVDRIGTTGTTWLGLTVACAQCHTHKFDPITHKEYFGLMAFLNNADEPEVELPSPDTAARRRQGEAKIEQLTADLPNKWPVERVEWEVASTGKTKARTATAARLEPSADHVWRAAGPVVERDTYTFEVETELASVDRVKVEVLADGDEGPGRTPHGNFVLSEVAVTVAPAGGDDKPAEVKISGGEADYNQPSFAVADALDGKPRTGWGVGGAERKSHAATFKFEKPVALSKGGRWTVTLAQEYGEAHTIGRLRLSLGGTRTDDGSLADRRKQAVQTKYEQWLAGQAPRAVEWTVLRPAAMTSTTPTLTLLPDGSILGGGDVNKSDTYELTFKSPGLAGVTAVRIEALPHESLPKRGPGMAYYEGPAGDFCLSEINLWAGGAAGAVQGKFGKTAHSYAAGNFESAKSIDGNPQTGWMINGQQGKPHVAVFALDRPTGPADELKLSMLFERHFAPALGHFRVSVTTDPRALSDPAAMPPAVAQALRVPAGSRSAEQEALLFRQFLMTAPELAEARKEIDRAFKALPEPPTTLVMTERPAGHARTQRLYERGEFLQPADPVEPGVPAVLPPLPPGAPRDRLTFARWLVSPENPLTARVTVNRQWQALFGRGIVRTTEDFGYQGEQPTHQDLLDWLAVEFVKPTDGGTAWSMKRLHKLIVTSSTYRQASAVSPELLARDPQNLLLARGPRFRAEAEVIRDAALRASELLSGKMFGPSVFPPQPASVTNDGAYGKLAWTVSAGEDRYRRSLYTFAKRTAPFAMFNTFDAPSGEACLARREVSNTPLQALTLLNDETFVEASQALGKLTAAEPGDDAAKATFAFRRVLTRPPGRDELEMLTAFAAKQRERLAANGLDLAKVAGAAGGSGAKDKEAPAAVDPATLERAVWTAVARAVMNLDEAVVKN